MSCYKGCKYCSLLRTTYIYSEPHFETRKKVLVQHLDTEKLNFYALLTRQNFENIKNSSETSSTSKEHFELLSFPPFGRFFYAQSSFAKKGWNAVSIDR